MRQYCLHIQQVHPLLDTALHADQPESELVLQQFADRPDTTVAQMIDVVDFAFAQLQVHEIADHFDHVLRCQRSLLQRQIEGQLLVQLQAPDRRKIVPLGIHEQIFEECARRVD